MTALIAAFPILRTRLDVNADGFRLYIMQSLLFTGIQTDHGPKELSQGITRMRDFEMAWQLLYKPQ
jgi:hypothetical protein